MFFTKPFLKGMEIYTPLLETAFAKDVEELIELNISLQNKKK